MSSYLIFSGLICIIFCLPSAVGEEKKYIIPDMLKEIPILGRYCSGENDNKFSCKNLNRLLFQAANIREHKDDYYFQQLTKTSDSYRKDLRKDIIFHIKN